MLDKRGCRILRLGGVQEGAGCDGVSAVGKRENGRAHATNWVARKPTQRLRLLTRATHRRHRIISPLDLFTSKKTVPVCWGSFFSVYSSASCGQCLPACPSSKPTYSTSPRLLFCSAGLLFERFLLFSSSVCVPRGGRTQIYNWSDRKRAAFIQVRRQSDQPVV